MSQRIHYTHCPVCGSDRINEVLTAVDHTVTKETFAIWQCADCSLRFTQDIPDAASIGPYYKSEEYISHTNTSKGLVNKIYQLVRKKTMDNKRKLVEKYTGLTKGSLLDMGCGIGTFLHTMKEGGWQVTGLEPDADARKAGEQLYAIDILPADHFQLLSPASFDAITLWHVLEHVHALHEYVEQLKQLLKPGGRLFIAVPNYTSKDAAAYKGHWAAYDVPRHLYHFSPKAIDTLMSRHGLRVGAYLPMRYDSYYISLLSNKYRTGRSGWLSAVWNGWASNRQAAADIKKSSSVIYVIEK